MTPGDQQAAGRSPRWVTIGLCILLAVGSAVFLARGTVRALGPGGNYDFLLIYSASRAWLQGENPYEKDAVTRAWMNSGGPAERDPMIARGPTTLVYPPPALAILSPLAALPWPIASWVWAIANTGFAVVSLAVLGRLARLGPTSRLALMAVGMCMAPLVTNTAQGQTAAVVVMCVCGGAVSRGRGQSLLSGVLLGIGGALKPQLGLLFVVYEVGRMRWKIAAWAAVAIAVVTLVGIGRMQGAGVDWSGSWQRNIAAFTTVDDGNAARSNPIRHQIINLHYPLHNFTDDREAVRWMVYAIAALLCAGYFVVDLKRGRQHGDSPGELVSLSFVSVVTLMVAYHRYYDAAILIVPLALAIRGLSVGRRMHAFTLACVLLFALPLPVILMEAARRGWVPGGIVESAIGEYLLLPCQAWWLVVLGAWLIAVRWREGEPTVTQRST
jgi:hypothetical protein